MLPRILGPAFEGVSENAEGGFDEGWGIPLCIEHVLVWKAWSDKKSKWVSRESVSIHQNNHLTANLPFTSMSLYDEAYRNIGILCCVL